MTKSYLNLSVLRYFLVHLLNEIICVLFYVCRFNTTAPSNSMDNNITDTMFSASHMIMGNSTSFEYVSNATDEARTQPKGVKEYSIYIAAVWLFNNSWKVVAPPGLLGNLVIIIVSLKINPFNSTTLFMISLAVVDLVLICLRIAMKAIQLDSTALCQSMWYLYNALPLFSNYILLFWTIERLIAVQVPLRVLEICTLTRTAIIIVAVGIFSFLVNIAWPVSIVKYPSGIGCTITRDKRKFIYEVWYKVDTSFVIFIPMIVIFLCNIIIIHGLQQSTKRHQKMTINEESRHKREKEQRNTTITLLSVSFAFLILHTPLAVYNCMAMAANQLRDPEVRATWYFINHLGLTVVEVQNSINFYLYFLTGRRYRKVTFNFFAPCRKICTDNGKRPASATKTTGLYSTEASN